MNQDLLLERSRQLLGTHPFPGADPGALLGLLDRCQPLRLMDGAELCREGEPGSALFFLVEGAVAVWRLDRRGQPRELARIDAPAIVGHMAVVDGSSRSATCTAVGNVRALVLERADYLAVLNEASPAGTSLRRLMLASLSRQLSETNRQLRLLLAGAELEEDLPEVDAEPLEPDEVQARPTRTLVPRDPAPLGPVSDELDLNGADPMPAAATLLSEEDLLEVTSILEGWKTRRS